MLTQTKRNGAKQHKATIGGLTRYVGNPLIIKNKTDRIAFQFGSKSALRATNKLVDQLQKEIRTERAQHRFNIAEQQKELAVALRELAEVRLELARRDREAAFAAAPNLSGTVH